MLFFFNYQQFLLLSETTKKYFEKSINSPKFDKNLSFLLCFAKEGVVTIKRIMNGTRKTAISFFVE